MYLVFLNDWSFRLVVFLYSKFMCICQQQQFQCYQIVNNTRSVFLLGKNVLYLYIIKTIINQ